MNKDSSKTPDLRENAELPPNQQPDSEKKEPTVPDVIQQLGQTAVPTPGESNVYCLTIIGQIEGHLVLPPQNKTTKYEHL
ncbi:MAG: translocation-enhancing protein TepA, partial [Paenibacillus macerans]|nr:translocation-enhancing protein TepA [Paenibacillus macerans]